jgi:hypothetical protein
VKQAQAAAFFSEPEIDHFVMAITAAQAMVRLRCPRLHFYLLVTGLDWREGSVMRNGYLRNPHEFDRWLKANAVLGSLLAIGMLAMALAGLNPAAQPDGATELPGVTALK